MDIAAYSINMNLQSVQQAVSTSVLSKAMNQDVIGMQNVLESITQANPTISAQQSFNLLDVRA